MPIEIRELVIRAVVEAEEAQLPEDDGAAVPELAESDRDPLIQACVEQVLRVLRRERER